MLTHTSRWSHARGNDVVPSRWQATDHAIPEPVPGPGPFVASGGTDLDDPAHDEVRNTCSTSFVAQSPVIDRQVRRLRRERTFTAGGRALLGREGSKVDDQRDLVDRWAMADQLAAQIEFQGTAPQAGRESSGISSATDVTPAPKAPL